MGRAAFQLAGLAVASWCQIHSVFAEGMFGLGVSAAPDVPSAIRSMADDWARDCFAGAYASLNTSCHDLSDTHKRIVALR